jgi:hypothetical protein
MPEMTRPELNRLSCTTRWSFPLISSLVLLTSLHLLSAGQASAQFLNSSEPGCDGSDPNKLFCEDFETPGVSGGRWYGEDCNTANRNGGINSRTKGWCGTVYANPITPPGAEICGNAGVKSNCAGNHGQLYGGQGGRNMADHSLSEKTDEIYVRYYQKWLPDYLFGQEKVLIFNAGVAGYGGIKWGGLVLNCGAGSARPRGNLQWSPVGGGFDRCLPIASIISGVWYYIEIHAKLSTTATSGDGRLRAWVNDCGASGTACGATPTLRLDQQNMSWDRKSPSELFGSLWWENWANPGSTGTSHIDQIVVSKTPIGFMK